MFKNQFALCRSSTLARVALVVLPFLVTACASTPHVKKTRAVAPSNVAAPIKRYPLTEKQCLARVMYFESNRSSPEGMISVGTVVMNRVNSTAFPSTICAVVGQKKQFAPGVLTRPMSEAKPKALAEAMAEKVLAGARDPHSRNAMFFHTAGYNFPYRNMYYVNVSGGNAFYEKRGRDGKLTVPVNDQPYDVALAFAQEKQRVRELSVSVEQAPNAEPAAPALLAANHIPYPILKPAASNLSDGQARRPLATTPHTEPVLTMGNQLALVSSDIMPAKRNVTIQNVPRPLKKPSL